jgi:hypothetical protein
VQAKASDEGGMVLATSVSPYSTTFGSASAVAKVQRSYVGAMVPDPNEAYSSENLFTVHKTGFNGKFVKRMQRHIPQQQEPAGGSMAIADLMAPQAPSLDLLISNNAGHGQIIEMENEEEDEDAAAERQNLRRGQSQSVFGKIRHRQESNYKVNTLDTSGSSFTGVG